MSYPQNKNIDLLQLSQQIKAWGSELGFQQIGIADTHLDCAETHLLNWLQKGWHGKMAYMRQHGRKRSRPSELIPGTLRVISARMDYFTDKSVAIDHILDMPELAFISRYALGRDYHKVLRQRLKRLTERIEEQIGAFGYRVFTDSAPVLEKALAQKAGLGWIGKHTNLINSKAGSWFFLGEIYTDLALPIDKSATNHCGSCQACIDVCPTQAIVGPYKLDARRCVSYLTIELQGSIPVEFRKSIGNRIYGCDDCQQVCPWNKFAKPSVEPDFSPRHQLDNSTLIRLFSWSEQEFLNYTQGSAIRRISYECWLRNIAVALGNAHTDTLVLEALKARLRHPSALVREHVEWALAQHQ